MAFERLSASQLAEYEILDSTPSALSMSYDRVSPIDLADARAHINQVRQALVSQNVSLRGKKYRDLREAEEAINASIDTTFHGYLIQSLLPHTGADNSAFDTDDIYAAYSYVMHSLTIASDRAHRNNTTHISLLEDVGMRMSASVVVADEFIEGVRNETDTDILKELLRYYPYDYIKTLMEKWSDHEFITRGIIKHFARGNPFNAAEALESYVEVVEELFEAYEGHEFITRSIIKQFALRNPSDPDAALKRYNNTVIALIEAYEGHEVITRSAIKYFAKGNPDRPERALESYAKVVEELFEEYEGHEFITRSAIKYFAQRNRSNAAEALESYAKVVEELFEEYEGHEFITEGIIKYYAKLNPSGPAEALERFTARCKLVLDTAKDTNSAYVSDGAARTIALRYTTLTKKDVKEIFATWQACQNKYPQLPSLSLLYFFVLCNDAEKGVSMLMRRFAIAFPIRLDGNWDDAHMASPMRYIADESAPDPEETLISKQDLEVALGRIDRILELAAFSEDEKKFFIQYVLSRDSELTRDEMCDESNQSWEQIEEKGKVLLERVVGAKY